ncbi:MAG: amidohydrolase family protein [Chloroflexi bacterium]|nr:amidohydrolase family protein [Chloroflexota bacterium]
MIEEQTQKIAICGATLIDGIGKRPIEKAVVIVSGKRIEAVGTQENVPISEDIQRIDAGGKYLLPGLIDLHVHIYHPDFVTAPPKGSDMAYGSIIAMNNLRSALQAGITTLRDTSDVDHMSLAMRTAVERGLLVAPRIFAAGIGICMTGGHGSELPGMVHEVDGPEAIRRVVREEIRAGVDWIKLLSSHRSDLPEYSQEEITAGTEEAHRLGKKLAIHAANFASTRMAAVAGVDTIEHGSFIDPETADLMAEKDITLVPTVWVKNYIHGNMQKIGEKLKEGRSKEFSRDDFEVTATWFRRCVEQYPATMEFVRSRGIRIATGTDSVFPEEPWAVLHREIEFLTHYGLSNMEAIQAATRAGAEALGKADQFGTVEPGKLADLILVDQNPLEQIKTFENVSWVMKEGAVIPKHPEWLPHPVGAALIQ